jgi:hypothetical protein
MKTERIFVDTSVLGGCFDVEFAVWSNGLVEDFRKGVFRPVVSDVTAIEVALAPERVRELHREVVALGELVAATEEVVDLVSAYEAHEILVPRYRNDMLHIALATVASVDVVVSWNFRHIVRLDKIRLFNGVNIERGYQAVAIYSPREVTTYGRDDSNSSR